MTYRKRRIHAAPNKNDAKVHRRESLAHSGIKIEALNPSLEKCSLQLDFYDAKGNFLDRRPQTYGPHDSIALQVECIGPCGNGVMDLEGKIRDMINKQETVSEGRAKCAQTLYAGANDVCGYELRCHAEISYKPRLD